MEAKCKCRYLRTWTTEYYIAQVQLKPHLLHGLVWAEDSSFDHHSSLAYLLKSFGWVVRSCHWVSIPVFSHLYLSIFLADYFLRRVPLISDMWPNVSKVLFSESCFSITLLRLWNFLFLLNIWDPYGKNCTTQETAWYMTLWAITSE